jgi:ribosomal-protein-alanine N-acetyltransferase
LLVVLVKTPWQSRAFRGESQGGVLDRTMLRYRGPEPHHVRRVLEGNLIDAFDTERLSAERLREADFPLLCRMHRDPRVMVTLGGVRADSVTRKYLDANLRHWEEHGFGHYVLRRKDDGRFAGRAGLRRVEVGGNWEVELAYAFLAEFWGAGLATEIAQALLSIGFGALRRDTIVCFALTANRASQRVMEKAGFAYERDIIHAGWPHVLYRISPSGS